jgi:hypothetical protein
MSSSRVNRMAGRSYPVRSDRQRVELDTVYHCLHFMYLNTNTELFITQTVLDNCDYIPPAAIHTPSE